MGSSNAPDWNVDRHPDLGPTQEFPPKFARYEQEMWTVPKDVIYAAISAIEAALGYMPQIKTDVPRWQQAVDDDIVKMQCAVSELRKLPQGSSR